MDVDVLLRALADQAAEHTLILMDEYGKTVGWMMGSANIFGRSADEMLGRTIHCLFTPEDQAAGVPESELMHARQSGAGEDDRWMMRGDGARFWASGVVYALRDGDRLIGYAKVLRDRTDVRGQVEALRNRAELLAAEDKRKVLLLGTLAHELRNPLGAISNAAHLIDHAFPGDARLSYALQVLKRQTRYVSALVEDLLETVRVRTGKVQLQYTRFELGDIVADALLSVDSSIRQKNQHVEILRPASPITIEGDRMRLTQVLVNLLGNASKFSGDGTRIFVKWTLEGDEAVIRVEDQGRGIAPALLPSVFDLLSQAGGDDEAARTGLGLGLSIVKEYVEVHGGTVQVRSEGVGRGSEFMVRLPLEPRPQGAVAAQSHGSLPVT
ncbi:MAG TPA: PAS domain-containing sensor histidine kinase [Gammaproteobacteria bacterium]|nr:PAS domain-containing sensor histidine kinase [Gammaproteobacteria bacterium]